jgi:hypothetical protein
MTTDCQQGVCLGSGIGNFDEIYDTVVAYEKDVRRPRIFEAPKLTRYRAIERCLLFLCRSY